MRKRLLLPIIGLIIAITAFAQTTFSHDPDSSVFLTTDINNFWKAFDDFQKDSTVNPFGKKYLDVGSSGVKGFTPNRIESADHLFATVKQRRVDYAAVRQNTLRIKEKEKQ